MTPLRSALTGLALLATGGSVAAETNVRLVQMHPAVGVGEEVFLYAVPKRLGYFKAEGLSVEMQQAAGAGPAAQLIQNGSVEFATTMPEAILQTNEQGGNVTAIYNLKRDNGSRLAVANDSPIHTLADLRGKTIGAMAFSAGGGLALRDNLTAIGLTPDQYTTIASGVGPAAVQALTTKRLDGLVLWEALYAAAENTGAPVRAVDIPFGSKMGGMTLAARRDWAEAHTDTVGGFCRAVAKGLQFAMANPEAAIRLFWEEFPQTKPTAVDTATALRNQVHILEAWFHYAEAGLPAGEMPGEFLPDTWRFSADAYQHAGVLKNTRPPESGFTTKYLSACNNFDAAAIRTEAQAAH